MFCPTRMEPWRVKDRSWAGRRRGVTRLVSREVGAFAPYLFVRTDEYRAAERVAGVVSLVKALGSPLVVPDRVMGRIMAACDASGRTQKDPRKPSFWFEGKVKSSFRVVDGPFAGFIGTISSLARLDSTGCVEAWVSIFGRVTPVTLPLEAVGEPLAA